VASVISSPWSISEGIALKSSSKSGADVGSNGRSLDSNGLHCGAQNGPDANKQFVIVAVKKKKTKNDAADEMG
jgi:hypothetical protein